MQCKSTNIALFAVIICPHLLLLFYIRVRDVQSISLEQHGLKNVAILRYATMLWNFGFFFVVSYEYENINKTKTVYIRSKTTKRIWKYLYINPLSLVVSIPSSDSLVIRKKTRCAWCFCSDLYDLAKLCMKSEIICSTTTNVLINREY